jgi:flavorubredoxin
MTVITEIAPDTYRISIYVREIDFQFNHMLITDDEPLLFATGSRAMFPLMREAVETLIDPARLRWIGFGHFEGDECGSLNQWLELAPRAQPVCGYLGGLLNINDFALRPARTLAPDDVLITGKYCYRFCPTPHLPHGWDSGVLFEETERTLLCSDLFFHGGNVEPLTADNLVERTQAEMLSLEGGPLADAIPYTAQTKRLLYGLADLRPRLLATAHGSSFAGDGAQVLRELHQMLWETFSITAEE